MEEEVSPKEVWESCLDLSRTFPNIFPKPETLLSVSYGWHKILYKYGPLLEAESIKAANSRDTETNELYGGPPCLVSAKQKYGRLDLSLTAATDELWDLVSEIEDESLYTCEVCGSALAKQETKHGWISTVCQKHKGYL